MPKPIMNLEEITLETQRQGYAFEARLGAIGVHFGAVKAHNADAHASGQTETLQCLTKP